MSERRVIPIDFIGQGPVLKPTDPELYALVDAFARRHLSKKPCLTDYAKTWATAIVDRRGKVRAITGLMGYGFRPDVSLFRSIDPHSTPLMVQRLNDYFSDQGLSGREAFIYISDTEPEEARCPNWQEHLKEVGATPAERWKVTIR